VGSCATECCVAQTRCGTKSRATYCDSGHCPLWAD